VQRSESDIATSTTLVVPLPVVVEDKRFSANFEFNSLIQAALASRAFGSMLGEIVNAFERRADRLFGQMASGTMVMAPQGHSCAQTPQPLQKS